MSLRKIFNRYCKASNLLLIEEGQKNQKAATRIMDV